jgi:hypothetical protein
LKRDAIVKTYERLGKNKPHVPLESALKEEKDGDEAKRPLSPKETGGAVSAQQSIDVKADHASGSVKADNVEVKDIKPESGSVVSEETPTTTATPTETEHKPIKKSTSNEPSSSKAGAAGGAGRKLGKPRRKGEANAAPYEGLFDAKILMELTPPMMEITDLRQGIEGGQKTWQEPIHCLICGEVIE